MAGHANLWRMLYNPLFRGQPCATWSSSSNSDPGAACQNNIRWQGAAHAHPFDTNVGVLGKKHDDLLSADLPFKKDVNENVVIEKILGWETLFYNSTMSQRVHSS